LFSTIGGGGGVDPADSNSITSNWSVIGGGAKNRSNGGLYATIAGGVSNSAYAFDFVGGGSRNNALGGSSTVAGGEANDAAGLLSTVGGGYQNDALAPFSTISGGYENTASGENATIPGGINNHATGRNSFAAGEGARAHHNNSFIWSDGTTWIFDSAATTSESQFIIMTSGKVGIGLSSPTDKLHVKDGNIRTNGCLIGSNLACPSDARLKEDIHTLDHALDRVGRLRGVEYLWRDEVRKKQSLPEGPQVGLIAQEVQEVVPQAVIEGSDGYLTVDYSRLVPLLIEAVKEQQRTISQLSERVNDLQKKLEQ
jgi:hypothetical protein